MGSLKGAPARSVTASRKSKNGSGERTERSVIMDVKNANIRGDAKGNRTRLAHQANEIEAMFALIDATLTDAERRTDRLLARTT